MFIDTHVHLDDERYTNILDQVITEAQEANVYKIITMGCDYRSSLKAVEIANKYPNVYAMIGIHPTEIAKSSDEELALEWINDLIQNPKVIGIGEIGLDYYWDRSNSEKQKEIFIKQIEISKKLNLPINVHSRDANQDTFDIIKELRPKGIIHCYSGSVEMAKEFVKIGFYIGVGGVVTFKNSKVIKDVVSEISLGNLVTETDGPYLAPTPNRGKTNYPKYIPLIVEEISKIKSIDIKKVQTKIEENVSKIFNI